MSQRTAAFCFLRGRGTDEARTAPYAGDLRLGTRRNPALMHPRTVRAEREVVPFPTERVDAWARFDTFVEEEHERVYKGPLLRHGEPRGRGGPRPGGLHEALGTAPRAE